MQRVSLSFGAEKMLGQEGQRQWLGGLPGPKGNASSSLGVGAARGAGADGTTGAGVDGFGFMAQRRRGTFTQVGAQPFRKHFRFHRNIGKATDKSQEKYPKERASSTGFLPGIQRACAFMAIV